MNREIGCREWDSNASYKPSHCSPVEKMDMLLSQIGAIAGQKWPKLVIKCSSGDKNGSNLVIEMAGTAV